ncbi:MAG: recombination protein RecR [Candidatus Schekmanbacteria bacterium]|nr:recombination protein RecR [Candidatus Schekmanbacteria bacterium]
MTIARKGTGAFGRLVKELKRIPGIGTKSAERIAFHVVKLPDELAFALSDAIRHLKERVRPCAVCGNLSESNPCEICADEQRRGRALCVVEETNDLWAIESSGAFAGRYHVLGGALSPLDGVGPERLRIGELVQRIQEEAPEEIIVATNPTAEGEATAHYLACLLRPLGVRVTRIARGVPMGGDLEYADPVTMAKALQGRADV